LKFLINRFIHQLQFFSFKMPKIKKEKLGNARHRHPSPKRKAIQATRVPVAATGAARRSCTILALGAFSIYKTTNHEEE
jgi:hypothetical protein